jgi:DNA-binding transcriptional regulator of glucitol operon
MNMLTFTALFASLWICQMVLNWRQVKRFMADVATLRASGDVVIGRGKRRGMRSYAALAVRDGRVAGSRILTGVSVFARSKPNPALLGASLQDLIDGTVNGLDRRTAAAATHAATLYKQQRRTPAAAAAG